VSEDKAGQLDRIVRNAAEQRVTQDEILQNIFLKHYGVIHEQTKEKDAQDPGYLAWAMYAVDVSMHIARAFLNVKRNSGTYESLCAFTYQLATNDFWQKNASVLMPLIHMALNTHRDGVMLTAERETRGEYSTYDALISASRAAPLEIFPVIAYLIGGPTLMVNTSLQLKLDLAPYFLN
jgi:hypothetical protein